MTRRVSALFLTLLLIGGTTFAIGIPFAKAWYQPSRRGFATGVFGAGMGGTALSSFFMVSGVAAASGLVAASGCAAGAVVASGWAAGAVAFGSGSTSLAVG